MNIVLIILIMVFSVFISSCSQVVLKKSAGKTYKSKIAEYLNPPVMISYGVFFISTLIGVFCLKYVPLSLAPVIESLGYVFVGVLGYFFLKERFTKRKLLGIGLIILGLILFSV